MLTGRSAGAVSKTPPRSQCSPTPVRHGYPAASSTLHRSSSSSSSSSSNAHAGPPAHRLPCALAGLQPHHPQHPAPPRANPNIPASSALLGAALAACVGLQVMFGTAAASAAGLAESSSMQTEGNIPSQLSAAGEQQAPRLSSLLQGTTRRQVEGCTRRCVPTCIRGGEGAPGLGPISMRKEIVVFKDGFRSRSYCLSECTQVCALIASNEEQQQQQPPQQQPPEPLPEKPQ